MCLQKRFLVWENKVWLSLGREGHPQWTREGSWLRSRAHGIFLKHRHGSHGATEPRPGTPSGLCPQSHRMYVSHLPRTQGLGREHTHLPDSAQGQHAGHGLSFSKKLPESRACPRLSSPSPLRLPRPVSVLLSRNGAEGPRAVKPPDPGRWSESRRGTLLMDTSRGRAAAAALPAAGPGDQDFPPRPVQPLGEPGDSRRQRWKRIHAV